MYGTVRKSVHWALASRLLSAAVESLSCDPNISIIGSCVVIEGLGWIFVIHLQTRLWCDVPDVGQLIVHIPHVIFDVYSHIGRVQYLHVEVLREGTDEQSPDGVRTGHFIGHSDLFGLLSILQVEKT